MKTFNDPMILISALLLMLGGCGDVRLARDAARSTKDMSDKMDQMLERMESIEGGMDKMQGSVDDVLQDMNAMQDSVDDVRGDMSTMQDTVDGVQHTMEKEMKPTMERMESLMHAMQGTVLDMWVGMSSMLGIMRDLSLYGKQMGSNVGRHLAWSSLIDPQNKIEAKLLSATVYYYAYEYQTLSSEDLKKPNQVSTLLRKALEEFHHATYPLAQSSGWVLSPNSKDNTVNVLYALSGAMHEYNYNQDLQGSGRGVSFEDLAMQALAMKAAVEQGELEWQDTPPHVREGLFWHELLTYMLQLRHNFLTGLIVQKVSHFDEVARYNPWGFKENLAKARSFLADWHQNYDVIASDSARLSKITTLAHMSNRVRHFLRCRGVEVKTDPLLAQVVAKMQLDETFQQRILAGQAMVPQVAHAFIDALSLLQQSVAGTSPQPCLSHLEFLEALDLPEYFSQSAGPSEQP